MINLEEFNCDEAVKDFDFKIEAGFGGFLEEGFTVDCFADVEMHNEGHVEEDVDFDSRKTIVDSVTFWQIEIKDAAGDKVKCCKQITDVIKIEIEYELTIQIED